MQLSRRNMLGLAFAGAMAMVSLPVMAGNIVEYDDASLQAAVNTGEPYLLDFSATWCGTCKAQERVLDALQAESAAYNDIQILRVDWDTHRSGPLVATLAIPRRSTLVMMQGQTELGRIVAGTSRGQIQALMDLGL